MHVPNGFMFTRGAAHPNPNRRNNQRHPQGATCRPHQSRQGAPRPRRLQHGVMPEEICPQRLNAFPEARRCRPKTSQQAKTRADPNLTGSQLAGSQTHQAAGFYLPAKHRPSKQVRRCCSSQWACSESLRKDPTQNLSGRG
jgi:hypothetical protein